MSKSFKRKRVSNIKNKNSEEKNENNTEKYNEESKHEKMRTELTINNFDYKNTSYYRYYSMMLQALMKPDELELMFLKSIDRLPTCMRFRSYNFNFSKAHNYIRRDLEEKIKNVNEEIKLIKAGKYNDTFVFSEEELKKLNESNLKFIDGSIINAIIMPEISRKDLRKAKRGALKENRVEETGTAQALILDKDAMQAVNDKLPIFKWLSSLQKSLNIMNEYGIISRQELVSMLPPLVLQIEPNDFVLDMCSAPGSKSKQLSEYLCCTGLLVANELEYSRTNTLTNNLKAGMGETLLGNTMVINHPAQFLPDLKFTLDSDPEYLHELLTYSKVKNNTWVLRYNKVLCDVPCTGDGAIRKCPNRWWEFKAKDAYGISALQYCIAERGFNLLAVGGLLAYSTCSINVVENEAVVARLLSEHKDAELVDLKTQPNLMEMLRHFKYSEGVSTWDTVKSCRHKTEDKEPEVEVQGGTGPAWKVPYQNDSVYMQVEYELFRKIQSGEVENWQNLKETQYLKAHHFQDHYSTALRAQLTKCLRIYPHQNDSGGFFVALIRKNTPLTTKPDIRPKDPTATSPVLTLYPNISTQRMKEQTFFLNEPELRPVYDKIAQWYGFTKDISHLMLLHSCKSKHIYIVNETMSHLLRHNSTITPSKYEVDKDARINHKYYNVAYFGCVLFKKDKLDVNPLTYRLAQDGLNYIKNYLGTKRVYNIINSNLLEYLLFFDLSEEFKTFDLVEKTIDEVDVVLEESKWSQILESLKQENHYEKLHDYCNGSLVIVLDGHWYTAFKYEKRIELRVGKEMKLMLLYYYQMIK